MSNRIQKKEVVRRLAKRLDADEKTAETCLDTVLDFLGLRDTFIHLNRALPWLPSTNSR